MHRFSRHHPSPISLRKRYKVSANQHLSNQVMAMGAIWWLVVAPILPPELVNNKLEADPGAHGLTLWPWGRGDSAVVVGVTVTQEKSRQTKN